MTSLVLVVFSCKWTLSWLDIGLQMSLTIWIPRDLNCVIGTLHLPRCGVLEGRLRAASVPGLHRHPLTLMPPLPEDWHVTLPRLQRPFLFVAVSGELALTRRQLVSWVFFKACSLPSSYYMPLQPLLGSYCPSEWVLSRKNCWSHVSGKGDGQGMIEQGQCAIQGALGDFWLAESISH